MFMVTFYVHDTGAFFAGFAVAWVRLMSEYPKVFRERIIRKAKQHVGIK